MTFGLMAIGFAAATNPGRVALARAERDGDERGLWEALAIGVALVVLAASVASSLLDWLDISPESFRIAAGIVVGACALKVILWPRFGGPLTAVLLSPDLAYLAMTLGADEQQWKVFAAAAGALPLLAVAMLIRPRSTTGLWAQAFASLGIIVAVVLIVAGIRDV